MGKKRRQGSASGFTLVELLIVLAIVALLASLVTPSIQSQIDRARAEEEWIVMRRELDALSWRSFFTATDIDLRLADDEFTWSAVEGAESGSIRFRFLRFPGDQQVTINEIGYASPDQITVIQGKRTRAMTINRWALE